MYISKRRYRARPKPEGEALNIVPYLDILMNLVIFLLASMTGFVTYGVLNVASPRYGGGSSAGAATEQSDKPNLLLTVLISEKGFFIAGAGAVLGDDKAEGPADGDGQSKPTVPVKADGEYDYEGLTSKMREIKKAFPNERKVIIGADAKIRYEVLVNTMDACREFKGEPLFGSVSLTVM